jgi:hypothetical protein
MEIISQSSKIFERLEKEGKITEVSMTSEQYSLWDEQMRKLREESIRKQNASWLAAKDVWLD